MFLQECGIWHSPEHPPVHKKTKISLGPVTDVFRKYRSQTILDYFHNQDQKINFDESYFLQMMKKIILAILLILLIPFTRFVVGKSYGSTATIIPLVITAFSSDAATTECVLGVL